jgi:hypothetical protein
MFVRRTFKVFIKYFYQLVLFYIYGYSNSTTPDFVFLPITNCSISSKNRDKQIMHINAHMDQYIAIYVRRLNKVKYIEMCQVYTLKQYFDLSGIGTQRVNLSRLHMSSEDKQVFDEFIQINKEKQDNL